MRPSSRRLTLWLLSLAGALGLSAERIVAASGEERTIAFYHIHTKETLSLVYKRDGKFLPEAMAKIDWIMRDWRKNETIKIDPETIDIIWEMHTELGSHEPIHIICGYRSRSTNEMLRKTVGGQASQSQHITGKAVDIAFPDIPVRQLRYSALVRERGGVGYYPTSAIPFVHVDTSRVRHWPRMARDELALLFPSGHSKHEPSDGRPISPADVKAARTRRKELATEVAAYLDKHNAPRAPVLPVMVAEAIPPPPPPLAVPAPTPAARPLHSDARMSVGGPQPSPEDAAPEVAPKLAAMPRLIERPSRFTPQPSAEDRRGLNELVTLAAVETRLSAQEHASKPAPVTLPQKVTLPAKRDEIAALLQSDAETWPAKSETPKPAAKPILAGMVTGALPPLPALLPKAETRAETELKAAAREAEVEGKTAAPVDAPAVDGRFGWAAGFVPAPAYDDDHPGELAYRPFPLEPFLTTTASADDPALITLVHPEVARTLDMLDDDGAVLPLRLRPGRQVAELLLAQEFRGEVASLKGDEAAPPRPDVKEAVVADRVVRTLPR